MEIYSQKNTEIFLVSKSLKKKRKKKKKKKKRTGPASSTRASGRWVAFFSSFQIKYKIRFQFPSGPFINLFSCKLAGLAMNSFL